MTDRDRDRDSGGTPQVPGPRISVPDRRSDRLGLRTDRCHPAPDPTDPAVFPPDAGIDTPTLPGGVPPYLVLQNDELTLTCAEVEGAGPVGSSVTILADTVSQVFDWRTIPGITQDRLNYIHDLPTTGAPGGRLSIVEWVDGPRNAALPLIRSLYKLNMTQSQFLYDRVLDLVLTLDDLALSLAEAKIDCYWENEVQTVSCAQDQGEYAVTEDLEVEVGTFRSPVSQAQANAQALAWAQANINCLYGNRELTVSCPQNDDTDTDNDILGVGFVQSGGDGTLEFSQPPGQTSIGEISVSDRTFTAPSLELAEQEAVAFANLYLECVYTSSELTLTCEDLIPGYDDTDEPGVDLGPANPLTGELGTTVTLPAGWMTSRNSPEEAQALARAVAEALLDCHWVNAEYIALCGDAEITDPADPSEDLVIPADETASKSAGGPLAYTNTVPAGTYRSTTSQEDADTTAQVYGDAQLFCVYCNLEISELCTVILDGIASLDRTQGAEAGLFCSTSAEAAQTTAFSFASIPERTLADGENCRYGNQEVRARCLAPVPGVGDTWIGVGARQVMENETDTDTDNDADDLSPLSTPNPETDETIVIAANTFTVTNGDATGAGYADAQEYANALAVEMAGIMLDCFWANDELTITCGTDGVLPETVRNPTVGYTITPRGLTDSDDEYPMAGTYFDITDEAGVVRIWFEYTDIPGGNEAESRNVPPTTPSGGRILKVSMSKTYMEDLAAVVDEIESEIVGSTGDLTVKSNGDHLVLDIIAPSEFHNPYLAGSGTTNFSVRYQGPWSEPDHPTAVTQVTYAAGIFKSYEGKAEAEAQALTAAQGDLICVWGNDEVLGGYRTGDGPTPGAGQLPGASIPANCSSNTAFSNPGVQANVIAGFTGKSDANLEAKALADAGVSCDFSAPVPELPALPCGASLQVQSAVNPFSPGDVSGRTIYICPGEVRGLIHHTTFLKEGALSPKIVDPELGAIGAALTERREMLLPASVSGGAWIYVTSALVPFYDSAFGYKDSRVTHALTAAGSEQPLVLVSEVGPESPYRQTQATSGYTGRLWVPLAYFETDVDEVTTLISLHTGDIQI